MLVLGAALAAAAAALHSVSERVDRTIFTAAGAHELVVVVHAGRIELAPSPDGRIQVATDLAAASLDARLTRGSISASSTRPPPPAPARVSRGDIQIRSR